MVDFFPERGDSYSLSCHQHHLRCKEDEETNVGLIGGSCKKRLRFGMKNAQGGVVPCEFQGGKMFFFRMKMHQVECQWKF